MSLAAVPPRAPEPEGDLTPDPADPTLDHLRHDLRWIIGQINHGYLAASLAAVGGFPGGMKGFYVLDAAVEGAAPTQIEVARRFNIDRTVMVRLIDEMERAGLVERRPAPTDRRARIIVPTERGLLEHRRACVALRSVDDQVLAPLSPDERAAFTGLAQVVSDHLLAHDPSRGAAACAVAEAALTGEAAVADAVCGEAGAGVMRDEGNRGGDSRPDGGGAAGGGAAGGPSRGAPRSRGGDPVT